MISQASDGYFTVFYNVLPNDGGGWLLRVGNNITSIQLISFSSIKDLEGNIVEYII